MNRSDLLLLTLGRNDFPPGDITLEVTSGDDVLSHVDVYRRHVSAHVLSIEVAAIANVCTDPQARGNGLASSLVRTAHSEANLIFGHRWAALFSDYLGFYKPLGYRRTSRPTFLVADITYDHDQTWPNGEIKSELW